MIPTATLRIAALTLFLPLSGSQKDPPEKPGAKLLEQMETIARETKVGFIEGSGEIALVEKPVFRYDDQPRRLLDATVWTWMYEGRPIAFQKIEALERGEWQYCFTSLAEDRLQVEWGGGRKFQTTEAGVAYRPVPDAPPIATRNLERRRQLREMARDFSARIALDSRGNDSQEMRLLTTPILEFNDQKADLLQGAVFGYSTNGTNPDLLIALESRSSPDKSAWHYAAARMTTGGVTVRYGDKPVWACEFTQPGKNSFPTWTYFQRRRSLVEAKE